MTTDQDAEACTTGTKIRIAIAAAVHAAYLLIHLRSAVVEWDQGQATGIVLTSVIISAGCALAVYGLIARRLWGRCLSLSYGLLGLFQVLVGGVFFGLVTSTLSPFDFWVIGVPQGLAFLLLIVVTSGRRMRVAFEERPGSPWRFDARPTRLLRWGVTAAVGTVPMLFWMAANTIAASEDAGRIVAAVSGSIMAVALFLVARGRTVGLVLLGASAIAGSVGAAMTVAALDMQPTDAAASWHLSMTVMAAVSLVPGAVISIVLFAAFLPRMVRFARA